MCVALLSCSLVISLSRWTDHHSPLPPMLLLLLLPCGTGYHSFYSVCYAPSIARTPDLSEKPVILLLLVFVLVVGHGGIVHGGPPLQPEMNAQLNVHKNNNLHNSLHKSLVTLIKCLVNVLGSVSKCLVNV